MDSDDSRLESLINQCKNNDVDIKVDALSKLQAEFESGIEINDPDGLIQVLKTCLRTSNQHLTTATLSVLPPLLPLLITPTVGTAQSQNALSQSTSSISSLTPSSVVDTATLRQVLVAFLPPGGLIERLGDKERAQIKARETLVILGGMAFRSGVSSSAMSTRSRDAKGPETPLMMFERYLREIGLTSKVWKVREQSIITLVHIRRAHQQFPIRVYLTQLVDSLEDTDAHVRDCARQSVIELFSGPGVSDAARADLKKEMTKKNVRKTIVDGVLSKLLGVGGSASGSNPQSREGSENGDTTMKAKEYVPPSLALAGRRPTTASSTSALSRTASVQSNISRPPSRAAPLDSPGAIVPSGGESTDVRPVYIASSRDLETEFAAMHKPFEGKENEHNWADRERAILRVRGMLKGEIHVRYSETFLGSLKDFIQLSLKTLASLRTTVATNTCSLYSEMAIALGATLDPFCDTLLTNLLRMAGFTKKLTAQQSQASVSAIIEHTSTPPRILLPLLWQTLQEKTVQARAFVVAHLKQYLEVHGQRSKHAIEISGGVEIMEKSLKKALADPNPAVRENARICFWVFEDIWRDRGVTLLGGLDSVARKQLEKACPNPELAAVVLAPSTPKPAKKSSVAAAIAASRAKAKAIATAPPTLRHQATASSHVAPVRRAGSPSLSPRNSMARPPSPLRVSTSPPSQKSRIVSNGVTRSTSAEAVTTSHIRIASGSPPSPPSPSEQTAFRRRTSSPLATGSTNPNRASTIRQALKTALPNSPSFDRSSPTPRNGVVRNTAVPVHARHSTLFAQPHMDDESLLLAQTVPIPGSDSDSESMDHSANLMSFSAAFEKYASPAARRRSNSPGHSFSPEASNALSSGSLETTAGQPVVEDALRARAEQAESAAERLLELVDPDDDSMQHSTIPSSLLVGNNGKVKVKPLPLPITQIQTKAPVTPVNRATAVMRQAAQFKNSPAYNGHSSASLMDVLHEQRQQTGWWLKRKNLVAQGTPLKAVDDVDRIQELQSYIGMLEKDDIDINVLQKVALLSIENPITDSVSSPLSPDFGYPASPSPFINPSRSLPSLHSDMWGKNKNFERLFNALLSFLQPAKSEEEIEYGLIALWEMLENQAIYVEGREGDVFSLLLRIRYCCHHTVLEATNTIRDALTSRIEPVYGLTTMHASLRSFSAEAYPPIASEEAKAASYAFGLIALGKFILRLPAEIAEEELPRLKGTLISALNDKSSLVIREAAAAAIISAQLALRDETHLFALLDGLADEKKNLLTYLFDKHGARGVAGAAGPSGVDKLEKEMRRLDTRTSTPPRPPT
ncbi:clasp N terminal-domain-containing protein [Mycena galericulata]|nr:clasp N terminal-domain-containing protein [Mycena galericulata]